VCSNISSTQSRNLLQCSKHFRHHAIALGDLASLRLQTSRTALLPLISVAHDAQFFKLLGILHRQQARSV
jgi:hypothetical protein